MEDQPHFWDFLVLNWIFHHHDRGLTKFQTRSEQPLMCIVIRNSITPAVKNNNTAYQEFGKYWMHARGLLNYNFISSWNLSLLYMSTKRSWKWIWSQNWGPAKNLTREWSTPYNRHRGDWWIFSGVLMVASIVDCSRGSQKFFSRSRQTWWNLILHSRN